MVTFPLRDDQPKGGSERADWASHQPGCAARSCVLAKYRNAGQVCASLSRFYVHEYVVDEFTDAFVRDAQGHVVVANDSDVGSYRQLSLGEGIVLGGVYR
jgi:hypothetical protein